MKKTIWIVALLAVCCVVTLCVVLNKDSKIKKYKKEDMQITEFNVEGRTSLKKENVIYVGNNIKELENNFYDIKIENTEYNVTIYLNKLWYETFGDDYIQDEYLAKICRELSNKLIRNGETEQFQYIIYKYIKDNYIKVRQNELVEKLITEKFEMNFELEDSVVKLIMRGI